MLTNFFGKLILIKAQLRMDSAKVQSRKTRLWRSGKMGTVSVGVNSLRAHTQNSKMARRSVNWKKKEMNHFSRILRSGYILKLAK